MQASRQVTHYAFIDALRGLAFLGVLVHHAVPHVPGLPAFLERVLIQGDEGVELFFVCSAMTLFLSLTARRGDERYPLVNFFIRRVFRIAPLFYAGALFYYVTDRVLSGGAGSGDSSLACIVSTLTFTNGWSIPWINQLVPGGWSIAVEMNFYLLVPWLYRKVNTLERALWASIGTLVIGGALSSGFAWLGHRFLEPGANLVNFTWYWLPAQMPVFCMGFVLFFLIQPILSRDDARPAGSTMRANLLLLIALYLGLAVSFSKTAFFLRHGIFGVCFVLLGWSLALHPTRWIVNPVIRYIGTISFSAYLTHFAALELVTESLQDLPPSIQQFLTPVPRFLVLVVGTLGLTVLVSTITYEFIERPGQRLGRSIIRRLEAPAELLT